jgi:hypothetical protein
MLGVIAIGAAPGHRGSRVSAFRDRARSVATPPPPVPLATAN